VAAAGVSMLVFFISKNSKEDEFSTQFQGASGRLLKLLKQATILLIIARPSSSGCDTMMMMMAGDCGAFIIY
jgi:hypothetical protein